MTRNPRGYVLIINNEEFTPGLPSRPGSDLDCVALKHIFQQLHFIVITETNKTRAVSREYPLIILLSWTKEDVST